MDCEQTFTWDVGMLQVSRAGSGSVEGLGDPRCLPKDVAASPGARMLLLAMCSQSLMLSKELS